MWTGSNKQLKQNAEMSERRRMAAFHYFTEQNRRQINSKSNSSTHRQVEVRYETHECKGEKMYSSKHELRKAYVHV